MKVMKRSKMLRMGKGMLCARIDYLQGVVGGLQGDNEYMSALIDELEADVVDLKVKAFDLMVRNG